MSAPAPETALVLAAANRAKAREMAQLLAGLPGRVRVHDLSDFPAIALPPEGETSYSDNALGKARAAAAATGLIAVADDSGIEVDALGGRPGVLSARFGGEGLDDEGATTRCCAPSTACPPRGAPRATAA